MSEAGGLPAVAYVLQRPSQQLRMFVHDMACAPAVASRDDVKRAAEQPAHDAASGARGGGAVIGRRRRESARAQARALWLDAVRIAEQAGSLDFRADPALHQRISQVCREAIADAFDAVWARKPAAAEPAIHEATAALDEWAELRRRQLEAERRTTPPSGAAHVLVAPSLAELTVASVRRRVR